MLARWHGVDVVLVFLVAFTVACAGTLIFQCIPIVAAWEFSLRPQAKCFSADTYTAIGLFNSGKYLLHMIYKASADVG